MKKALLGGVVALVLVVGGCLAVVAVGVNEVDKEIRKDSDTSASGGVTSSTDDAAISHAKIKSCTVSEYGIITARLVITNSGDDPASYIVTGEAVKGERRVAELNAIANNVRPGQKVNTDLTGSVNGRPDVECRLVAVDRF